VSPRWDIFVAMVVFLVALLAALFLGVAAEASGPREVKFYQDEPACADKKVGYVVLRGGLATTEHHRVWVCGLEYSR
jgi:hypothetical protein